ncbi:twin-arginine translocase TatA/TatE family subunit [Halomonas sp. PGE1]|uniref:twin-arginine translocase TatA/TatE family subunit n=1 Tax=Halomonas sp. PGE1 TaxID=2730360 RepID=UPI001475D65F|nr:twin-arginine translocase TatA/TatE family subunit [Halomonas sp. PGE1]QJR00466.1 twin-arginine translocase TatA/TatE family subunit [Halomonas sp. PGE1]
MLGGISIWQLLIVLGIIILIFGTRKVRNLGGDLGDAVKGFKQAMQTADTLQDSKGSMPPQHVDHEGTETPYTPYHAEHYGNNK